MSKTITEMTVAELIALLKDGHITTETVDALNELSLFTPIGLMKDNRNVDPEAVKLMRLSVSYWTKNVYIAQLASTPPEMLALYSLWAHPNDREVLLATLGNPNLPTESLAESLNALEEADQHFDIRCCEPVNPQEAYIAIAEHPNVSPEILKRLAHLDDEGVVREVLSNPRTPIEVLEEFVGSYDVFLRRSLASNPALPLPVILTLLNDENDGVVEAMTATLTASPLWAEVEKELQFNTDMPEEWKQQTVLSAIKSRA